ncbi:MAG: S-layer homology domain-containing protein [Firmicutes bacterium]|nr:S-layer homology domain-containing protein [Bacillota bacterium]
MLETRKRVLVLILLLLLMGASFGTAQGYSQLYMASPHGFQLQERLRFTDIRDHWAGPAIVRQVAFGILDGPAGKRFSPQAAVSRLEVLRALLRLGGLEANALGAATGDGEAGFLWAAQGAGIITPREAGELSWAEGARRQEVAAWLARTLDLPPAEPRRVRTFTDWPQLAAEYTEGVEALLAQGYLQGVAPGVLAPNQVMRRGEFASLVDRAGAQLLASRGIRGGQGQLIDKEEYFPAGPGGGEGVYYILTDGGEIIALRVGAGQGGGPGEPAVYREGHIGGVQLLRVGDRIHYHQAQGEIFLIEVRGDQPRFLQGKIVDLNGAQGWLDFANLQGEKSRLPLGATTRVRLNSNPARVEDLRPGQEVDLELVAGVLTEISAFLPEGEGGYIAPGSRVRSGYIRYLEGKELVLLREGQEESYRLTPQTLVVRGEKGVSPTSLRPGEFVTLYFADLSGDSPVRILAQGERQKLRRLYRGIISMVSPRSRRLILTQPAHFNMVGWEPVTSPLSLTVHPQAAIYAGGKELTLEELALSYQGREIYLAVPQGYGQNEGTKLIVKSGYGKEFYGRIQQVDWVAGEIELDSARLRYDPGTIFLFADRFIDPYALRRGQEVLVLAAVPGMGPGQALVVSVEDVEEPGLDIYWGSLDTIGLNHVRLRHISTLSNHCWRDWSRRRTLSLRLNLDTLFWDNLETGAGYGPMTKWEFDQRRVARDYEDCGALVISSGDEVVALGIWPGSIGSSRVTVGRIGAVDRERGLIRLERAKDWNSSAGEWRYYPGNLEVEIREAVAARGDGGTSWEELRPGDSIYLLREGMRGRLFMVY